MTPGSYTIRDVCTRLGISRATLYAHEARLRERGILVELLPRIGTARRFAVDPIERYLAGGFNAAEIRRGLRAAGEGR